MTHIGVFLPMNIHKHIVAGKQKEIFISTPDVIHSNDSLSLGSQLHPCGPLLSSCGFSGSLLDLCRPFQLVNTNSLSNLPAPQLVFAFTTYM